MSTRQMPTCEVGDCDRPVFVKARGLCRIHYHRWYRTGDPLTPPRQVKIPGTPMQRWWAQIELMDNGCWHWTGLLDRRGYGQFSVTVDGTQKNHRAHRWGYQQLVGPIPGDLPLDHLCHHARCTLGDECPHRACVNPGHLEPVTNAENLARGAKPGRKLAESGAR